MSAIPAAASSAPAPASSSMPISQGWKCVVPESKSAFFGCLSNKKQEAGKMTALSAILKANEFVVEECTNPDVSEVLLQLTMYSTSVKPGELSIIYLFSDSASQDATNTFNLSSLVEMASSNPSTAFLILLDYVRLNKSPPESNPYSDKFLSPDPLFTAEMPSTVKNCMFASVQHYKGAPPSAPDSSSLESALCAAFTSLLAPNDSMPSPAVELSALLRKASENILLASSNTKCIWCQGALPTNLLVAGSPSFLPPAPAPAIASPGVGSSSPSSPFAFSEEFVTLARAEAIALGDALKPQDASAASSLLSLRRQLLIPHISPVTCLSLSPDGSLLATGTANNILQIHRLWTQSGDSPSAIPLLPSSLIEATLNLSESSADPLGLRKIEWRPDGRALAVAGGSNGRALFVALPHTLRESSDPTPADSILPAIPLTVTRTIQFPAPCRVSDVKFSLDGNYLAIAANRSSEDGFIRIVDSSMLPDASSKPEDLCRTLLEYIVLTHPKKTAICGMSFCPAYPDILFALDSERRVHVMKLSPAADAVGASSSSSSADASSPITPGTAMRSTAVLSGHSGMVMKGDSRSVEVSGLHVSPQGHLLMIGNGTRISILEIKKVMEAVLSSATPSEASRVAIPQTSISPHSYSVSSAVFSRSGRIFATSSQDRTIRLYEGSFGHAAMSALSPSPASSASSPEAASIMPNRMVDPVTVVGEVTAVDFGPDEQERVMVAVAANDHTKNSFNAVIAWAIPQIPRSDTSRLRVRAVRRR